MPGDWETESSDGNSLIGYGKNNWQCILFKKLIALKIICMTDELSGVIRPISTAAPVKRQVLSYCLTILSPFKSREHTASLGTLYKL